MLIKSLLFGYHDTQCLHVAIHFNIADHLKDGPKSISQLAELSQAAPDKLFRVMRYLASKDLFEALSGQRFALNKNSNCLVSSNPSNLHNFIRLHATYFYQGATKLVDSMQVDSTSFVLEFGSNAGQYFTEDPIAKDIYNNAMRENSELYGRLIAATYDFSSFKTIVDVGGGIGSLLANILLTATGAHGINFDLPGLQTASENFIKSKGLTDRCQFVGGDFNESVPAGGDLYIMKAILHARNNDAAITVLKQCKSALSGHGKLLIIDRVIPTPGKHYVDACISDVNMLNITSGKVRTVQEFEKLCKHSGFMIQKMIPVTDSLSILELKELDNS